MVVINGRSLRYLALPADRAATTLAGEECGVVGLDVGPGNVVRMRCGAFAPEAASSTAFVKRRDGPAARGANKVFLAFELDRSLPRGNVLVLNGRGLNEKPVPVAPFVGTRRFLPSAGFPV